jgi:restriction alleviation protein Lar
MWKRPNGGDSAVKEEQVSDGRRLYVSEEWLNDRDARLEQRIKADVAKALRDAKAKTLAEAPSATVLASTFNHAADLLSPPPKSEPELLSCPFCGREATVERDRTLWRVGCVTPGYVCLSRPAVEHIDKGYAITQWNARKEST